MVQDLMDTDITAGQLVHAVQSAKASRDRRVQADVRREFGRYVDEIINLRGNLEIRELTDRRLLALKRRHLGQSEMKGGA